MKKIGILGGTFDPIHLGHTKLAEIILDKLDFDEIRFIPNYKPPHRNTPVATPKERLDMLKIALSGYSKFKIDDREIKRKGISYTIDTVKSLRDDFPNDSINFIIGFDEFAKLNTWHKWQELIKHVNFIVINRPDIDFKLNKEVKQLVKDCEVTNSKNLTLCGNIYQLKIKPFPISATKIRNQLKENIKPKNVLEGKVYEYIKNERIYS